MRVFHAESQRQTQNSLRQSRNQWPFRALLAIAAMAPVAMISGCAGFVSADRSKTPTPQVSIQINPASLNFGSVVVGKKASLNVSVANAGNAPINIAKANVSGKQFSSSGLAVPLNLPVGQSADFQVWFDPTSSGSSTGALTVQTDTGVVSGQVALTGNATSIAQQISVTPASLNMGSAMLGTAAKGTVTISNVGGSKLTISSLSVSTGPYSVSGITTPSVVTPGASVSLNVTYSPTVAGSSTGSLTVTSDDPQTHTSIISLSGSGTTTSLKPSITTQPANQTVTAGQKATFTVVAAGTAPLGYQWQKNGANIAGATSASYTTSATTASDNASTFRAVVSNTPGTVTSATATLTVNPASAPGIHVSSTSISFGNAVVGSTLSQVLIVTNPGAATLKITQVTESGSTALTVSGFSLPISINAGQQATITVSFLPTSAGAVSGNISVVSNAPSSPTSVGLSGTGVAATATLGISPTSLSFGNVTTGTSSPSQNITITNTGNSKVIISQVSVSGSSYSFTGGGTPVTLSPAQNITLAGQFNPTAKGSTSGSIKIVSNATGSPAAVTLSGTGVVSTPHSVALSWNASTSTVSGYHIYRSTVSGSGYTKMDSSMVSGLTYTDSTVLSTTTYYYVTTAVDSSGTESAFSNEVSATIP